MRLYTVYMSLYGNIRPICQLIVSTAGLTSWGGGLGQTFVVGSSDPESNQGSGAWPIAEGKKINCNNWFNPFLNHKVYFVIMRVMVSHSLAALLWWTATTTLDSAGLWEGRSKEIFKIKKRTSARWNPFLACRTAYMALHHLVSILRAP